MSVSTIDSSNSLTDQTSSYRNGSILELYPIKNTITQYNTSTEDLARQDDSEHESDENKNNQRKNLSLSNVLSDIKYESQKHVADKKALISKSIDLNINFNVFVDAEQDKIKAIQVNNDLIAKSSSTVEEKEINETVWNENDSNFNSKNESFHFKPKSIYKDNEYQGLTTSTPVSHKKKQSNDLIIETNKKESKQHKSYYDSPLADITNTVSNSRLVMREIQSNETVYNRQNLFADDNYYETKYYQPYYDSSFADITNTMTNSSLVMGEIQSNATAFNRQDIIKDYSIYKAKLKPYYKSSLENIINTTSNSRLVTKEIQSNKAVYNRQDLFADNNNYETKYYQPYYDSSTEDITNTMTNSSLVMGEIQSNETAFNRQDIIKNYNIYKAKLKPYYKSSLENIINTTSNSMLVTKEIQSNEAVIDREDLIMDDNNYEAKYKPHSSSSVKSKSYNSSVKVKSYNFLVKDKSYNSSVKDKSYNRSVKDKSSSKLAIETVFKNQNFTMDDNSYEAKQQPRYDNLLKDITEAIANGKLLMKEIWSTFDKPNHKGSPSSIALQSLLHLMSKENDESSYKTDTGTGSVSASVSSTSNGNPLGTQKMQIDFSPIKGIDDNKIRINKCTAFWGLIAKHPEIHSLKIMPEKVKVNEEPMKDTYSIILKSLLRSEDSKPSILTTPTCIDWMQKPENIGFLDEALTTKMPPKPFCEPFGLSQDLSVMKDHSSAQTLHPKLPSRGKLRKTKEPKTREQINSLAQMMAVMDKFDLEHPKSMEPPGHPPTLIKAELLRSQNDVKR